MYRNLVWLIFILIVAAIAFWFIIKAGCDVYDYFQLSAKAPATIEQWSVKEVKADRFAIVAHYFFEYQGKNYHGEGQVGDFYPNPWAAQEAKKRFALQHWDVWLNQKHPDRSVLEKHFPFKKAISAIVLIILTLYFLILGFYVKVKHG